MSVPIDTVSKQLSSYSLGKIFISELAETLSGSRKVRGALWVEENQGPREINLVTRGQISIS